MAREKVMLVGEMNTSKTKSLVSLAWLYPNNRVVIFDPDDGTAKLLEELGIPDGLDNLTVIPVTPDYEKLVSDYNIMKTVLGVGDWCCFDMLGRFWDIAQDYYTYRVYGTDSIEHVVKQKEKGGDASFGGLDGIGDWPHIKRLHNTRLLDDAVLRSTFNVMATTSAGMVSPRGKAPTTGIEGIYATEFGIKPEGEKHNIYRFDTQVFLYRKGDGTYHFRIVRDRGRQVDIKHDVNFTNSTFWEAYCSYRGIAL